MIVEQSLGQSHLGHSQLGQSELEGISRRECLALLSTVKVGRIAFHAGALPMILPVSYALEDRGIVARVRTGSQLETATMDAVVAFEADDVAPGRGRGWSVTVTGFVRHIDGPSGSGRSRRGAVADWAGDETDRLVCISLDMVSGRRSLVPTAATEGGSHERR